MWIKKIDSDIFGWVYPHDTKWDKITGFNMNRITHTRPQQPSETSTSNGLTADYYELPANATQLQDLISFKDMNAQVGESFRSLYRYGQSSHSDKLRDAKKVVFYMNSEIERLEKYG